MFRCRIDDTGIEFKSLKDLARFLDCSVSWVSWKMNTRPDKRANHFYCREYSITILPKIKRKRIRKYDPVKAKIYHDAHKAEARVWRQRNKDKVLAYKKKWNAKHQDWYNAYYRERRRIAREAKKEQQ